MTDCIFCKIIKGEIPCAKVYEDKEVIAFLDISPVNPGHTLVVPKEHHETLMDLPEEIACKVMKVVKKVASAVKEAVNADGVNINQSNLKPAGQLVPHVHFHVIPRIAGDGLRLWPQSKYKEGQMEEVRKEIEKKL